MTTKTIKYKKPNINIHSLGLLLFALGSASVQAGDEQRMSGWQCKPAGKQNQVSAQNMAYYYNGTVYNKSTTSDINIVCPILRKQDNAHIKHVLVNYTDNHPNRSVKCYLRIRQQGGNRKILANYYQTSPSGISTDNLDFDNSKESSGINFLHCTLPPSVNGAKSSINSIFVNQDTGYQPPWYCNIMVCFDPSGTSNSTIPAIIGQVTRENANGIASYLLGSGAIANFSYTEALELVFPLIRDNPTYKKSPEIKVAATIDEDANSLAECRLYQTNDSGGQEQGFHLTWSDSDNDGRGVFFGSGDDTSITEKTVFSVKCILPPRTTANLPRIEYIGYRENK